MKKTLLCAAIAAALPVLAQAATVATGATQVGDGAGINAVGGTSIDANLTSFYNQAPMDLPSEWVWIGSNTGVDAVTYEFTFDLSGFNPATAILEGEWGVDNFGTIELNGNLIAELVGNNQLHYTTYRDYGTDVDGFFLPGLNTVTYSMFDGGGPAGFRATATVTADPGSPVVPLPAGGLLLLAGLGGLAALRRAA